MFKLRPLTYVLREAGPDTTVYNCTAFPFLLSLTVQGKTKLMRKIVLKLTGVLFIFIVIIKLEFLVLIPLTHFVSSRVPKLVNLLTHNAPYLSSWLCEVF